MGMFLCLLHGMIFCNYNINLLHCFIATNTNCKDKLIGMTNCETNVHTVILMCLNY